MPQTTKISKNNTKVFKDAEGYTNVTLHNTTVVRFNESTIILNSNGWHTITTKNRMNQTSSQMGLGYRVYQDNYNWKVSYKAIEHNFEDNMTLTR